MINIGINSWATSRRCPDEADKHKIHVAAERTKHSIDTRQLKATSDAATHIAAQGVWVCVCDSINFYDRALGRRVKNSSEVKAFFVINGMRGRRREWFLLCVFVYHIAPSALVLYVYCPRRAKCIMWRSKRVFSCMCACLEFILRKYDPEQVNFWMLAVAQWETKNV